MSDEVELIIDDSEDYDDPDRTDTEGESDVLEETDLDEVEESDASEDEDDYDPDDPDASEDDYDPDDPDDPDASEDGNLPPNEDVVEAFKATYPNTLERKHVLDKLRRRLKSMENCLGDYSYHKSELEHRAVTHKDTYLNATEESNGRGTSDNAVEAVREKHLAELKRKIAFVDDCEAKLNKCRKFITDEKAIWEERKAATIENYHRDGDRRNE